MPLITNHVNLNTVFLCTELMLKSKQSIYMGVCNTVLNNYLLIM